MMNCRTAQRQIALAVGEDLPPTERQELQGHLQECSNCQQTWDQHQQSFAALQHSRIQEVPQKSDSVWPILAVRLQERAAESPRADFNGWFAALAVTAAGVLIFVFSQESHLPIASQPATGSVSGGTMVSSPPERREQTPPRPRPDEVHRERP